MTKPTIQYTYTDEAPALATHSWLPIVQAFAHYAGIDVETKDISLSGRILANFPDHLAEGQRIPDALTELGELAKTAEANIIKLPNVSASIPQLLGAIAELQDQGFAVPDFPAEPATDEEKQIRATYAKVLGSAVNPVLREGNSDRRVAKPVKEFAKKNPHSMGAWEAESKSHVASMESGDFFGSEQSTYVPAATTATIRLRKESGEVEVLKEGLPLLQDELIDSAVMSASKLTAFLKAQVTDAKAKGVLFSLHMKATMMKVSDPIIFGHCVKAYYADVFEKHAGTFSEMGVNPNNGIGDVYAKLDKVSAEKRAEIEADLQATYETQPPMAMVDSDRGITNLHVPSDIIIDASMPAAIRSSGKMWGPDGNLHDMKAVIPDRSYSGVYQAVIEDCQKNGAFDVTTMGNVSNVGLMAKKAEEYGSHDKTFEITAAGVVEVVDADGSVLMQHEVQVGDIWRMCQTKDVAIRDWVRLAVSRAKATGAATVFWLNKDRAHDACLIEKVEVYLKDHDTSGLDIQILAPVEATKHACERARAGQDSISVTGNVLRDYLTDLFPILELGTSAKMLSIVPLLAGGGLFETGAGGSAPKHVQQFVEEGHLRWDSLGEFLALAVSLEGLAERTENTKAKVLGDALTEATTKFLDSNKSPSRKVKEIDTRGSHFYLALYWAQALADQDADEDLKKVFAGVAEQLAAEEEAIAQELIDAQGSAVELGGYYRPDNTKVATAMRPSSTLNGIINSL